MVEPVILELAVNGATPRHRNRHVPRTPDEITEAVLAGIESGASIVHNHNDEPMFTADGVHAVEPYLAAWRPVLERHPDALLYPTMAAGARGIPVEQRWAHVEELARRGMGGMTLVDPGSVNLGLTSAGAVAADAAGGPYANPLADVEYMFARSGELRAAPSISVFEPGFLRTTLAWQRGGRLPPGAMVKLYFGGELEFGLPPTVTALEAYLELLEPSGLPWSVAVLGGDVVGCGMAELAIRRGGHVRVGLEDYAGPGEPSNLDLLRAAVALIAGLGHAPASTAQARQILGVPPATRLRLSACRSRCGLRLPGLCPACEPGSARDVEVAGDSVAIAGQELNALGHPVTFFLQRGEHLRSRFQTVTDQLDQLYADSASSGRVMALALHPFAIGQPFRAKYLDQALEYITGHPGVWLTTSDEIAAHFARVRPQVQQGR